MSYFEEYKNKLRKAEDVAEGIQSGMTVHIGAASSVPVGIEKAMEGLIGRRENIRITTYMHFGQHKAFFEADGAKKTFRVDSVFHNRNLMDTDMVGVSSYIPVNLRNLSRDLEVGAPEIDLLIVAVSPMDKNGYFTVAGGALVEGELIHRARKLAVEVLDGAPRLFGDTLIHVSQVDEIVESEYTPAYLPIRKPDAVDLALGAQVAQFVDDGATLQLGFGGLVDAMVSELKKRKNLGIHSEVVTDSTMELIESGAVNNSQKTLHRGQTVAAFWGGSKKFCDFINDNPSFLFRSISYSNDPYVMAQNIKMTSINAALQVDLGGQCASESIGARQFSGTGGQVDTAIGSQMAPGGKSIIAVRSTLTLKDPVTGEKRVRSRIVPTLDPGVAVTLTRSNVHYVVTEYGAVCLRGMSVRDRAKALIEIAHPDFRAQLEEDFYKQYKLEFIK